VDTENEKSELEAKQAVPPWRKFLCWAAVLTFFLFPMTFFVLEMLSFLTPLHNLSEQELANFKWMREYMMMLAGLVFGLAGLNSWDKRNGGKHE